jgi:hypothetical protein
MMQTGGNLKTPIEVAEDMSFSGGEVKQLPGTIGLSNSLMVVSTQKMYRAGKERVLLLRLQKIRVPMQTV